MVLINKEPKHLKKNPGPGHKVQQSNQKTTDLKETGNQKQRVIHDKIKEYVKSFNISRTAATIGLTLGIGYTIYYLLRYRERPLGGFLKGLINNDATIPSPISTNNITITMPSLDNAKNTGIISNLIEGLSPFTIAMITGVFWLLKRK